MSNKTQEQLNEEFERSQPHCPLCDRPAISCIGHSISDLPAVGDLNSDARGSGARKNAGKPDWSQFPLWTISEVYELFNWITDEDRGRGPEDYTGRIDIELGKWQRGDDQALEYAAVAAMNLLVMHGVCKDMYDILSLVVRVLEFGEKKYKKGNWAKGMPWSVCYTCAVSHFMKYASGRTVDEESGIHTLAHLLCNVLFLIAYRDLYPEGDDRMPEFSEPEEKEFYGPSFEELMRGTEPHVPTATEKEIRRSSSLRHYGNPDCTLCAALGRKMEEPGDKKLFDLGPFVPLEPHT